MLLHIVETIAVSLSAQKQGCKGQPPLDWGPGAVPQFSLPLAAFGGE
ncbi:MAG: hypothetical protein NVS4B11_29630 [Ktedonobacteraceae bacterium]